jgi:hypothetical protein
VLYNGEREFFVNEGLVSVNPVIGDRAGLKVVPFQWSQKFGSYEVPRVSPRPVQLR